MKRILLAGLLGGLAVFVWSSISHRVLPLRLDQFPGWLVAGLVIAKITPGPRYA